MEYYSLIARALETRGQAYFEQFGRENPSIRTAKASLKLHAPEYFEKGFAIYTAATGVDAEMLSSILCITDEKNPKFIAIKQLDKVVRLIQYVGGATAYNSYKPKAFREVVNNWEKGGNLRKGVIDSFVAIFAMRIADFYKIPRDAKGRITGARNPVTPTTEEINEMFCMTRTDIRSALNYRTYIDDKSLYNPARVDMEMSAGAGDFGRTTSPTQASQIRGFFIALGLASGKKNEHVKRGESPKLIIPHKVAMMICKAVKANPINPKTMENLNG